MYIFGLNTIWILNDWNFQGISKCPTHLLKTETSSVAWYNFENIQEYISVSGSMYWHLHHLSHMYAHVSKNVAVIASSNTPLFFMFTWIFKKSHFCRTHLIQLTVFGMSKFQGVTLNWNTLTLTVQVDTARRPPSAEASAACIQNKTMVEICWNAAFWLHNYCVYIYKCVSVCLWEA